MAPGISIPLGLLLVLLIIIAAVCCTRRIRKKGTGSKENMSYRSKTAHNMILVSSSIYMKGLLNKA